jgi:hypothetical protein
MGPSDVLVRGICGKPHTTCTKFMPDSGNLQFSTAVMTQKFLTNEK